MKDEKPVTFPAKINKANAPREYGIKAEDEAITVWSG